ncbi:hypothetical protein KFE25_010340 [Diacronema lutheri]|uniref:Methyltransferase BMT2 homolog n=1 Tax=Diacronema lutheri TaxID=2081491 RepID=A0A8J6CAE3_DIALT|nr:hypothetical protein KFE25_010340 [Diacronema lutheri]
MHSRVGALLVLSLGLATLTLARRVGRLAASSRALSRGYFARGARAAPTARAPADEPAAVAAADAQLVAHVERQLGGALSNALKGEPTDALDATARTFAEQLARIAARWHGAAPPAEPAASADAVPAADGELSARADACGALLDGKLVNRRLVELCALACERLECEPADARPLAAALARDARAASNATLIFARGAAAARQTHRARALWTFGTIQAQHHSLRASAPAGGWADATHEPRSLSAYAIAAESMGERAWVQEGFEWCAARAVDFFFEEGWRRLALRPERVPAWYAPQAAERPRDAQARACFAARAAAPREPPPAPWRRRRLRLCDVGSCYDPFSAPQYADLFDVTALDLWPAAGARGVLRCDFLHVPLISGRGAEADGDDGDGLAGGGGDVRSDDEPARVRVGTYAAADGSMLRAATALTCESFDVVVLSLVLSYLPSAEQRAEMVRRARALLRRPSAAEPHVAGLLLIVDTPSVSRPPRGHSKTARPDMALSMWVDAAEAVGLRFVRHEWLRRDAHALAFQTVPGPTPPAGSPEVRPMPVRRELLAGRAREPPVHKAGPPAARAAPAARAGGMGVGAQADERLRWLPDLLPPGATGEAGCVLAEAVRERNAVRRQQPVR